ncbi:MAG: hypothetical protein GC168_13000 [Candidatus Hydrogenedens sp.]|nr:hypothetical protein [Candidatus Hydrogenedens sp.]
MTGNRGSVFVRLITALVLIAVAVALIWVPRLDYGFMGLVAVFAFVGAREYYQMASAKGHNPEAVLGEWVCGALAFSAIWNDLRLTMLVFFVGVMLAAWLHILRGHPTLDDLAVTVFGMTYVGLIAAHFSLLHAKPVIGPGLVTMTLAAVALSDTGAYFAGKNFGRHKMAPRVSPKKTWEGSIGGLITAMLGMGLLFAVRDYLHTKYLPEWPLYRYIAIGLVLAIAGQVGDLVESMLKRDAGVKDSGQVLPGHGGVLDRCDGFLFAGPVMYYLFFLGEG